MDELLHLDTGEMDEKIHLGNDDDDANADDDADADDDNRGIANVDDPDEDDDSDFLAFQQKLMRGSTGNPTTSNQREEDVDDDNENSGLVEQQQQQQQQQQQTEQHDNDDTSWQSDSNTNTPLESALAPSVDELQQRIYELEAEVSRRSDSSRFLQTIQMLESTKLRLLDENSELHERIHQLEQQNQRLLEKDLLDQPIVSFKFRGDPSQKSTMQGQPTIDDKDEMIQMLENFVQKLEQRIMDLVQEKLQLKLDLDRMEHEIKYYQQLHPNTPNFVAQTREAWLAIIMNQTNTEKGEGDEDDEDPNHSGVPVTQKDFLKIAMENKMKRESGFGFGFLKGTSVNHSTSNNTKDTTPQQSLNVDSSTHHDDSEGHRKLLNDDVMAQEETPGDMKSSLAKNVSGFVSLFVPKKPNVTKEEDDEKSKPMESETGHEITESAKHQEDNLANQEPLSSSSSSLLTKNISGLASLFGSSKKEEDGKTIALASDEAGKESTEPPKNHNNNDLTNNKGSLIDNEINKSQSAMTVSGFASLFGSKKINVTVNKDEDGTRQTKSADSHDACNDGTERPKDQDKDLVKEDSANDVKTSIAKNVTGLASLFGTKKTEGKRQDDDGKNNNQLLAGRQDDDDDDDNDNDPAVSSVVMESMMLLQSDSPNGSIGDDCELDETVDFGGDEGGEFERELFALLSEEVKKQQPGES